MWFMALKQHDSFILFFFFIFFFLYKCLTLLPRTETRTKVNRLKIISEHNMTGSTTAKTRKGKIDRRLQGDAERSSWTKESTNERVSRNKRRRWKEGGKIAPGQNWERDDRGCGKGGEKKGKRQTGRKYLCINYCCVEGDNGALFKHDTRYTQHRAYCVPQSTRFALGLCAFPHCLLKLLCNDVLM